MAIQKPSLSLPTQLVTHSLRYNSSNMQRAVKEVRIKLPSGQIAGKWWGPRDKRPILALHGWQDNCGTFDRLIPLLPEKLSILAIDIPGHGLSQQLPPGMFYHAVDLIGFIKQIVSHFNWAKVSLLGHSLGAMQSNAYTMLYPDTVDFLVCLDCLHPYTRASSRQPTKMADYIDKFLKFDSLNSGAKQPPSHTYTEMEKLLHKGSLNSIDLEMCKYILNRNIAPVKGNPDRFYVTRDPRLKVGSLLHWTDEMLDEGSARITCPLFFCMSDKSTFVNVQESYLKRLEIIKQNNPNVESHSIKGTHHFHLNTPEVVSGLVTAFIEKYQSDEEVTLNIENKIQIMQQ